MYPPACVPRWLTLDEFVADPLVISFVVIMPYEFAQDPAKMVFSQRDDTIEAFLLY